MCQFSIYKFTIICLVTFWTAEHFSIIGIYTQEVKNCKFKHLVFQIIISNTIPQACKCLFLFDPLLLNCFSKRGFRKISLESPIEDAFIELELFCSRFSTSVQVLHDSARVASEFKQTARQNTILPNVHKPAQNAWAGCQLRRHLNEPMNQPSLFKSWHSYPSLVPNFFPA